MCEKKRSKRYRAPKAANITLNPNGINSRLTKLTTPELTTICSIGKMTLNCTKKVSINTAYIPVGR